MQDVQASTNDDDDDDDDNDDGDGDNNDNDDDNGILSGLKNNSIGGGNTLGLGPGFPTISQEQEEVNPAMTDSGTITNNTKPGLATYENKEHGFAFELPNHWDRANSSDTGIDNTVSTLLASTDPGRLSTIKVEPAQADEAEDIIKDVLGPSMGGLSFNNPSLEVKVHRLNGQLDPNTLQVRNSTAAEFGRQQALVVENMGLYDTSSVPITNQIVKNEAPTIGNKSDAWRLDYITSVGGSQTTFHIEGFVIGPTGKLFKLDFSTSPTSVPQLLPEFERMLHSFRFIDEKVAG